MINGELVHAPQVAKIFFDDTLRSANDEFLTSALAALRAKGGADIVANVIRKYIGLDATEWDERLINIAAEAGSLNINAQSVLDNLVKQIEAYLNMTAEERAVYRQALVPQT